MNCTLYIDDRENWIKEQLDFVDFKFKITRLDVGDFIIKNENEEIQLVIERKTTSDLYHSIIDKRYTEQLSRMEKTKSLYIIEEDSFYKKSTEKKKNIINGCLLNLLFKHEFKIITTCNKFHTIEILKMLLKKIQNKEFVSSGLNPRLISKTQTKKDNVFFNQLCCIPSVTPAIATKLENTFKCMDNFLSELKKDKNCIMGLQINNDRKLGKVIVEKIYNELIAQKNEF